MKSPRLPLSLTTLFLFAAATCPTAQAGAIELLDATPAEASQSVAWPQSSFGLAGRLPADTDFVFGVRELGPFVRSILDSKMLAGFIELDDGDTSGLNELRGVLEQVFAFAGEDLFVAMADGSAVEIERLTLLSLAYNELTFGMMEASLRDGSPPDVMELVSEVLYRDNGRLLEELVDFQLPRLIISTRPAEGMTEMLMGEALNAVEGLPPFIQHKMIDVEGHGSFHKLSMNVVDALPGDFSIALASELGEELGNDVQAILENKVVEVTLGVVDGALVATIGPDHTHLKFAPTPAHALVKRTEIAELDTTMGARAPLFHLYVEKELMATWQDPEYVSASAKIPQQALMQLTSMFGPGTFGDAPELLGELFDRLTRLAPVDPHDYAMAIWPEDGLKCLALGSPVEGVMMNGDEPLEFLALAPEDAFLTFSTATTTEAVDQALAILEVAGPLIRDVGLGGMTLNGQTQQLEMMREIDSLMSPLLADLWELYADDYVRGIGLESAIVMDFGGGLPLIPELPKVLQENAPGPRMVVMNQVADRAKLARAWESLGPIVTEFSERMRQFDPNFEFELPQPTSAGADEQRSHYYPMPLERADFLPALTLDDSFLLMGTSRAWNEELIDQAAKPAETKDLPRGLYLSIRLDALHRAANEWLTLTRDNLSSVFEADPKAAQDFQRDLPKLERVMQLLEGVNGFDLRADFTNRWRTTWHLDLHDAPR